MLNKTEYMGIFEDYSKWEQLNKIFDDSPQKPGIKQQISQGIFGSPIALNNAPLDVVSMYAIEQKENKTNDLMTKTEQNLEDLVKKLTTKIDKPEIATGFALNLPYFESGEYSDLTEIHKEVKRSEEVLKNKDINSAAEELIDKYGVEKGVVYHAQNHADSLFGIYQGIIQANVQKMAYEFVDEDVFQKDKFEGYMSHLASNEEEASKYEVLKTIAGNSYHILTEENSTE